MFDRISVDDAVHHVSRLFKINIGPRPEVAHLRHLWQRHRDTVIGEALQLQEEALLET